MKKLKFFYLKIISFGLLLLLTTIYLQKTHTSLNEHIQAISPKYNETKPFRSIDDIMHLVVVACKGKSGTSLKETLNMVKTAFLFTRGRLRVHIFTKNLKDEFRQKFATWPKHILDQNEILINDLVYPLSPEESSEMMDWWEPCASFRLFLPMVMSEVDSILYVDTDILFLAPIEEIWKHFLNFDESHVGGLAPRVGWDFKVPDINPNFISTKNGKLTQVNSGVFLMNLTRMRNPVFSTAPELSRNKYSWSQDFLISLYKLRISDMYGDQNLINTIFHFNPGLLYFLPCRFNYQHKFCFDNYKERFCSSAEEEGAFAIHGSANTFYNNYAPAFRVINDIISKYHFENDLRGLLLKQIEEQLKLPSIANHPHCSNKLNVFLETLKKSIEKMEYS